MKKEDELKFRELQEAEKRERLNCPYCNPSTSYGASPEFFDQWKIKHDYHKTNLTNPQPLC